MASRTQQKAEARERRLEQEQAAARAAGKRRRMRLLAGTGVIAIVIVAVVIAISIGGSGGTSGLAKGKTATKLSAQVHALLSGIPQHGTTLGNPLALAKDTLTLYGDLQCPICADLTTGADGGGLPQFIKDQVRPGHAKIVYRSFCTATCSGFTQSLFDTQQAAAYAAGDQGKFWDYEELFYRQQGTEGTPYVTPTFLRQIAHQIPGLNLRAWTKACHKPRQLTRLHDDEQAATKQLPLIDGGRGTPGLLITGPKGTKLIAENLVSYDQLAEAIKTVS